MKDITPDAARHLWNSLTSEAVGVADGEEVSNTTRFGIMATSNGAPLCLARGSKTNLNAAILLETWAAKIRESVQPYA